MTNGWRVYKSPTSLYFKKFRELTMAVLTLHNWLGTVYMPPRFFDAYDLPT